MKKKTCVRWSEDDIDFLENNYELMTVREMSLHLVGRSESAIYSKMREEGLIIDPIKFKHNRWNLEKELKINRFCNFLQFKYGWFS